MGEWVLRVRLWAAHPDFKPSGPAISLLVLNLLDALFTLWWLQLGLADELNPLMRCLYDASPLLFVAVKLVGVGLGLLLLCRHRHNRLAKIALWAGNLLYAGVVVYHLAFAAHLVTTALHLG